jgi:hypothetical protein
MSMTTPAVFICYRGDDEPWAPDVVYAALADRFGADAVFKAGYSLLPGDVFPSVLEEMAAACRVMLVCIGPRWLNARNAHGTRRLDEKDDWVRTEIELALQARNHVIPLLLGNPDEVVVPTSEELPTDLAPLSLRQGFRLQRGGQLKTTLPLLAERLVELVPSLATPKSATRGMTIRQSVGTLDGKATGVQALEGAPLPFNLAQEIDTVSETGVAVGLELLERRGHS